MFALESISAGTIPDLNRRRGDPYTTAERINSFFALAVTVFPNSVYSTPVAMLLLNKILAASANGKSVSCFRIPMIGSMKMVQVVTALPSPVLVKSQKLNPK